MNIETAFGSYLKAADIGDARPVVVISHVALEMISSGDNEKEKKPVVYFNGKEKGLILNKTNADTIRALTGTPETDEWTGFAIRLWVDPNVRFAGRLVPAVRVMAAQTPGRDTRPTPPPPPPPVHQPPPEYGISHDDDVPF